MLAPICRVCGMRHWGGNHVWPSTGVPKPSLPPPAAPLEKIDAGGCAPPIGVEKSSSPVSDPYDPGRKEYFREYMRKRRAEKKGEPKP